MNKPSKEQLPQAILDFVTANPGATGQQIATSLNTAFIVIAGAANKLANAGLITLANKQYTLTEQPKATKAKRPTATASVPVSEVIQEVEAAVTAGTVMPDLEVVEAVEAVVSEVVETEPVVEEVVETSAVEETPVTEAPQGRNYGRDFKKVTFRGEPLSKGKAMQKMVAALVAEQSVQTEKDLEALLPKKLVRGAGTFTTHKLAKLANEKGRVRYYTQGNMAITLGNGTKVCVTNQLTKDNFPLILAALSAAGLTDVPTV